MIDPKELRIGNWVHDPINEPQDVQVNQIRVSGEHSKNQNMGVSYRNHSDWIDCRYLEPIRITEEWLEKFGFYTKTKYPNGHITSPCCDYAIRHNERLNSWYWFNHSEVDGSVDWIRTFHIKYIHQLQNLYFALTGEELEVK